MGRKLGSVGARLGFCDPRLAPTQHPTTIDIAWAAGIYEGEGSCFGRRYKHSRANSTVVTVGQKHEWILHRLKAYFGGNIRSAWINTRGIRTISYWHLCGARGRGFLMTIYPFLSPHRKEQALRAIR